MKIRSVTRSGVLQTFRRVADHYVWTHPSILATFQCRPAYLTAFQNTWRSLLWSDPRRRRLREAVAVAVSAANGCVY